MAGGAGYTEVYYWVQHYGRAGVPDQRAVQDFIECETTERIQSLKLQLHSIAQGNYEEDIMDQRIGPARKAKHGSYSAWAKLMLMWTSSYYKPA